MVMIFFFFFKDMNIVLVPSSLGMLQANYLLIC